MRTRPVIGLAIGLLLFLVITGVIHAQQQSPRILVNGRELSVDVPPRIIDGRTMVPIRFVSEALGASVGWDGESYTVTVTYPNRAKYKEWAEAVYLRLAQLDAAGAKRLKEIAPGDSAAAADEASVQVVSREALLREVVTTMPPPEGTEYHLALVKTLSCGLFGWQFLYEASSYNANDLETKYLTTFEQLGWERIQLQRTLDTLHSQLGQLFK